MSFETTITEHELDPATVAFAQDLARNGQKPDDDYRVDGFHEPLSQRIMRLFRRSSD